MELLNHTKHHIVSVLVLQRFIVVQKVGGDSFHGMSDMSTAQALDTVGWGSHMI